MNPSIYIHNNKILVNLRAVNYTFYHSEKKLFQHPYGPLTYIHPEDDLHLRTRNFYLELDDKYEITRIDEIDTSKFPDKQLWEFVGLEDVRIFCWEGKLYTTGVRRDLDTIGTGRMELCEIEVHNNRVVEVSRVRIEPPNNQNSYCEKNWMPILDLNSSLVKVGVKSFCVAYCFINCEHKTMLSTLNSILLSILNVGLKFAVSVFNPYLNWFS